MQAAASVTRPSTFGEQWVGEAVDGRYPLQKCLSASDHSALFLTEVGGETGAKAVIKLVLANSCDAEAQLALWRRAARLSHPHLLRILDGGRCWLNGNDLIFLVSEYADENLGEVLPRRTLTANECNALLRPMITVLKYIHAQGLAHGRLRPSNVMAVNDELKVSSDCIRPAGELKAITPAGAYEAPELATGKISSATDVWSLGAILAECLPSKSASGNGSHKILPKPFGEIVRYSLRQDPASRWTLTQIEAHLDAEAALQAQPATDEGPGMRRYLPVLLTIVLVGILAAIYGLVRAGGKGTVASKGRAQAASETRTATPAGVSNATSAAVSGSNSLGAISHEVGPAASPSSLRTIHGRIKIRVRVQVDDKGNVVGEKLITAGPSKYFSRLAMQAAQQWKFTPPAQNGVSAPSQWTILFEYTRGGTSEQASAAAR